MLRFFTKKKLNPAVRRLYDKAVTQARQPIFYQTFAVPDTLDGRFDMVVFHVWPLIDALRDEKGAITPDGQALFDTFVDDMEQNLRTIGVSDTSVGKKMKAIGRAFYGRFDAYCRAADESALAVAIARNILEDVSAAEEAEARTLARYAVAMRERARGAADLLAEYSFPDPADFADHDPAIAARVHASEVTP